MGEGTQNQCGHNKKAVIFCSPDAKKWCVKTIVYLHNSLQVVQRIAFFLEGETNKCNFNLCEQLLMQTIQIKVLYFFLYIVSFLFSLSNPIEVLINIHGLFLFKQGYHFYHNYYYYYHYYCKMFIQNNTVSNIVIQ